MFWEDLGRIPLPRAWISLDFLLVFYGFLLILLISTRFGDPRIRGPPNVRTNEPVGGVGGTAALKIAIRLRRIEIGEKFKNIRNQRLRKLASHQKNF